VTKLLMEITDVKIHLVNSDSKVKAVISLVFENALVIHGIKVIEGSAGMFVAMPSRKTKENEYKDIVHPITNELRQRLQEKVLESYQKELTKQRV